MHKATTGFTLVELSIVLVIIGLIIGGVLTGQSLIRSAELRSVISDVESYKVAIRTFKDQYFYKPGDIPNAQDFWPSAAGEGNGDGTFFDGVNNAWVEGLRAWQHLALSGMIKGTYEGHTPSGIGVTFPESAISGMGFQLIRIGHVGSTSTCTGTGANSLFGHAYLDVIQFGFHSPTNTSRLSDGALSAVNAWTIDKKIDDGLTDSGKILSTNSDGDATGCIDGDWANAVTSGTYDLDSTSDTCRMIFILD